MNNRGQLAPDYLGTVIFLGIMALVMFGAYGHMQGEALNTVERMYAREQAQLLAEGINYVVLMGDGGQKSVRMPRTFEGGYEYNITVRPNVLLLQWQGSDYAARFSTGRLSHAEIKLTPADIMITNINGTIHLESIN